MRSPSRPFTDETGVAPGSFQSQLTGLISSLRHAFRKGAVRNFAKTTAIQDVEKDPNVIYRLDADMQNDMGIISAVLKTRALELLDPDPEDFDMSSFGDLPIMFRANKEVVKAVVQKYPGSTETHLRSALFGVGNDPKLRGDLLHIPNVTKDKLGPIRRTNIIIKDKEIMLQNLRNSKSRDELCSSLEQASADVANDIDVLSEFLARNVYFRPEKPLSDISRIKAAENCIIIGNKRVILFNKGLHYASESLKNDKNFVIAYVLEHGISTIENAGKSLKNSANFRERCTKLIQEKLNKRKIKDETNESPQQRQRLQQNL